MSGDVATIAEDGDVIGDLEDLVHLVGDVNDADSMGLEVRNDREEVLRLRARSARRWAHP